jgi:hypothetical protein
MQQRAAGSNMMPTRNPVVGADRKVAAKQEAFDRARGVARGGAGVQLDQAKRERAALTP